MPSWPNFTRRRTRAQRNSPSPASSTHETYRSSRRSVSQNSSRAITPAIAPSVQTWNTVPLTPPIPLPHDDAIIRSPRHSTTQSTSSNSSSAREERAFTVPRRPINTTAIISPLISHLLPHDYFGYRNRDTIQDLDNNSRHAAISSRNRDKDDAIRRERLLELMPRFAKDLHAHLEAAQTAAGEGIGKDYNWIWRDNSMRKLKNLHKMQIALLEAIYEELGVENRRNTLKGERKGASSRRT